MQIIRDNQLRIGNFKGGFGIDFCGDIVFILLGLLTDISHGVKKNHMNTGQKRGTNSFWRASPYFYSFK